MHSCVIAVYQCNPNGDVLKSMEMVWPLNLNHHMTLYRYEKVLCGGNVILVQPALQPVPDLKARRRP